MSVSFSRRKQTGSGAASTRSAAPAERGAVTTVELEHRLRVVRPILPEIVRRVEVRGLGVAGGRVDLEFRRTSGGRATVQVLGVEGDVDVVIEDR
jgi:hypothetical protein